MSKRAAVIHSIIYAAEIEAWNYLYRHHMPATTRDIAGEMREAGNRIIALADRIKGERRGEIR
jgi:methyl coenzyme M reductase subunit C-like uncharacterized protein (methanogenesis marker protein 7)